MREVHDKRYVPSYDVTEEPLQYDRVELLLGVLKERYQLGIREDGLVDVVREVHEEQRIAEVAFAN